MTTINLNAPVGARRLPSRVASRVVCATLCVASAVVTFVLIPRIPASETVTVTRRYFQPPEQEVSGVAFDGHSLWITIDGAKVIYETDPETLRPRRKIAFPSETSGGSAWDGHYLWQLAWASHRIYRVDTRTGAAEDMFATPGVGISAGLAYDGQYLWVANVDGRKLYKIDQNHQGAIVKSMFTDFETAGIAWDGRYLWSGILVGTKEHSEATPLTGFVRQLDLKSASTLAVFPVSGVGGGGSDWVPGQSGLARRFWWYDGYHHGMVRLDVERMNGGQIRGMQLAAGLLTLASAILLGFTSSSRSRS